MNAFADWLFSVLLGWTGNIANEAWRSINNDTAGFTSLIARIWLPLLVILLLAGTMADFVVWLIRWRPHYVWRSRGLKRNQQRQMNTAYHAMEHGEMSPEYREQIAEWVVSEEEPPLPSLWDDVTPNYPGSDVPPPVYEEPYQQPSYPPYVQEETPQEYHESLYMRPEEETYIPYADEAPVAQEVQPPYMAETPADPADYLQEDLSMITPEMQTFYDSYVPETPYPQEEIPQPAAPRRRRSEGRRKPSGPSGLIGQLLKQLPREVDEEDVLNGLPPPVSHESAFRSPVYPDSYQYRDANVQPYPPEQQRDGNNGQ